MRPGAIETKAGVAWAREAWKSGWGSVRRALSKECTAFDGAGGTSTGKRQEARGKRQEARGKRQEARCKNSNHE